jgi:hypothetical protein
MEPAASLIKLFGGPTKVARICGLHRTRVAHWRTASDKGGTGGAIPHRHHATLIAHARSHRIRIKASDFIKMDAIS